MDQLGAAPALREADRPQPARNELRVEARRFAERRRAHAELLVQERRVPEGDRPLRARRRVRADDGDVEAEQRLREPAGVRDRRGREQELRLGAVHLRETAKAAQDVPHVRAEHAAVDVRLVDDDVAQVREHVPPAVVVREEADVEHVGVREDQVRPLADLPALLRRRVPVVDRGARARQAERGERAGLVLRERFRGVEVERAELRVACDRVEDGEVERERLARGGARRDHDVLAALRRVPGLPLVRVERVEREQLAHEWVQAVRDRSGRGVARGLVREVRELLSGEEVVPACELDGHRLLLAAGHPGARDTPSPDRSRGLTPWHVSNWTGGGAGPLRGRAARRDATCSIRACPGVRPLDMSKGGTAMRSSACDAPAGGGVCHSDRPGRRSLARCLALRRLRVAGRDGRRSVQSRPRSRLGACPAAWSRPQGVVRLDVDSLRERTPPWVNVAVAARTRSGSSRLGGQHHVRLLAHPQSFGPAAARASGRPSDLLGLGAGAR